MLHYQRVYPRARHHDAFLVPLRHRLDARTQWVELLDAQLAAPVLGRTCRFDQVMGEKQPSNMNISLNISKPSLHMIMAVYISKQDINDIDIMKRNSMKHIKTIILHGGLIYSQLKKNITSIAIEHD